jgi:hypothetical protein
MDGRDLIEVITNYGVAASGKKGIECAVAACPRCQDRPGKFWRHGARLRLFLVFAVVVLEVKSYLPRWKCPSCRRTFTQYPPFALPFKRYPLPFIRERVSAYVTDEGCTYESGVSDGPGIIPVFHKDPKKARTLRRSTLWRWVSTLGGFPEMVRRALDLIKQKDPSSVLFRALGEHQFRGEKFRSQARKGVLQRCRELLLVEPVYAELFDVKIFPDLATGVGWK